jgi:hypothetical protein
MKNKAPDYQIQASDILYIKISSTNKEINEYFEIGSSQLNNQMGGGQGNNFLFKRFLCKRFWLCQYSRYLAIFTLKALQ